VDYHEDLVGTSAPPPLPTQRILIAQVAPAPLIERDLCRKRLVITILLFWGLLNSQVT